MTTLLEIQCPSCGAAQSGRANSIIRFRCNACNSILENQGGKFELIEEVTAEDTCDPHEISREGEMFLLRNKDTGDIYEIGTYSDFARLERLFASAKSSARMAGVRS